jgi:peptidyl-prolyl cis-trans isomerase B (cyclophilin B)
MAVAALVCALIVAAPLGILFGHLALNAASRGQAQNEGVALAALVIGYLTLVFGILWVISS